MTWTLREKALTIAWVATIIVASVLVLTVIWRIRSTGRIKAIGVGVYWDAECTVECNTIDWGFMKAGELKGVTLFAKNTRNVNLTLSLLSELYEPPEAQQYLTIDWNDTGLILTPEQIRPLQLTLYVSLNVTDITTFNFDIIVLGTEA